MAETNVSGWCVVVRMTSNNVPIFFGPWPKLQEAEAYAVTQRSKKPARTATIAPTSLAVPIYLLVPPA